MIDYHVVHQHYGIWVTLKIFLREMRQIHRQRKIIARMRRNTSKLCVECGTYWADEDLCPGCEAYREHQR